MKLVDRVKLMEMPPGTIYCEFQPMIVGELMVKGDTISMDGENIDWYENSLGPTTSCDHSQLEMNIDICREGCFDPKLEYLVLEPEDVQIMVDKLLGTYDGSVKTTLGIPDFVQ